MGNKEFKKKTGLDLCISGSGGGSVCMYVSLFLCVWCMFVVVCVYWRRFDTSILGRNISPISLY